MILEYHRPEKMEEALNLLARETPRTYPLGGGTVLNAPTDEQYAVVDLQDLGLENIEQKGSQLKIGAAASLQSLLEYEGIQPALAEAIRLTVSYNLRQTGTAAGALVSGGRRSPFLAAMLALDAQLSWQPGDTVQALGEFVHLRGGEWAGALITEIGISLQTKLAYHYVARSPADQPVVCAAAGRWASGRTRIVLGGYGKTPQVVMDGEANEGVLDAVGAAYLTAEDEWASAEYRSATAKILARRCLEEVSKEE